MSEVRPIRLPGSSALALVLQRTRAALTAWARDWLVDARPLAALSVESATVEDLYDAQEVEGLRGANGHVWFRQTPSDRANFGQAVLGAGLMPRSLHADDWISEIAADAWALRNRALCESLVGAPKRTQTTEISAQPASLAKTGCGAVKLCCEPFGLHAIADAGVWSQVPPTERKGEGLPALVSLERAARHQPLRLEVLLGSAELELPKVLDLRRGDVLRLSARLDQPLTVCCEGRPFARVRVGDVAGRKAIQFTDQHH